MKRKIGAIVLFGLLILTVVALTNLDTPAPRAVGATSTTHAAK